MAFVSTPLVRAPRRAHLHRQMASCAAVAPPAICSLPSEAKRFSRRAFLAAVASAAGSLVAAEISTAAEPAAQLQYTVVKNGNGPTPEIGDLIGIRFKGAYNGVVFDNLFEDKTPYFYRAGSGAILKVGVFPLSGRREHTVQLRRDTVPDSHPAQRFRAQKPRVRTYAIPLHC